MDRSRGHVPGPEILRPRAAAVGPFGSTVSGGWAIRVPMIYTPQRRSNVALAVVGGLFATVVVELLIDLLLHWALKSLTSHSVAMVIVVIEGLVVGAVTGGVICLGRPRHYGVVAVAAIGAVVMAIIGDLVARPIFAVMDHIPLSGTLFTSYFMGSSLVDTLTLLTPALSAGGITAIRVAGVRRAGARAAQAPLPMHPPYGPPPQQPPWGGPPPGPQPPWRP